MIDGFMFYVLCCGLNDYAILVCMCYNRLLETDKRALTRITSTNSTTEGTEQKNPDQKTADQKSTDQKTMDQKNGGTVDRKRSIGSVTENMEGSLDSPSLGRKATDEELW